MKIEGLVWYLFLFFIRDWYWVFVEIEVIFGNNIFLSLGSLNLEKSVVLFEKLWVYIRLVFWW